MGVIDTAKDLMSIVQKLDNIELQRKAISLQQELYDLQEEVRVLRERLANREQLSFRRNAYWRGEEGPFCSRCFDVEGKVVRLHVTRTFMPMCPACTRVANDPDSESLGIA